ncbi:MAG: NMD3-related protein [Archaeoglobaceae archaeon]|nr:NMD3-related protein [Archaeoglobaceae archaeon]
MKCVVCGKETKYKICGECLVERQRIASIEKFDFEFCSRCGSVKIGREWQKINLEEAIKRCVDANLRIDPEFHLKEIFLAEKFAILKGFLHGDYVEVNVPLGYKIRKICCPRCSMESGGYYEAIVQLRAGRELRIEEIERVKEIVSKFIVERGGEKDFLAKFEILKNGIDFYLGNRKLGEIVAKKISDEFGGKIFESKKLHTRVDGRDSYRFTFLVKLPEYEEMDVVTKGDRLYVVKNARIGKGLDFLSGKHTNIVDAKIAVRKSYFKWGVITNLDKNSAEVMTEKGEVIIVERPFSAEIGKEVFVFEYKNKIYAFPKDI